MNGKIKKHKLRFSEIRLQRFWRKCGKRLAKKLTWFVVKAIADEVLEHFR